MSEEEEKAIERATKQLNETTYLTDIGHKDLGILLNLIQKRDKTIVFYKRMYEKLCKDFETYKNGKDINYLDGIHYKKLVEKSIGQIINKPEQCWFDAAEVKIIKNGVMYGVKTEEDFVSLKEISDKAQEECITVIAESPLSGAIYRYNNHKKKEWQLVGTMLGYA